MHAGWLTTLSLALTLVAACDTSQAQTTTGAEEAWGLHGQATYVWQTKPAFRAAYSGTNSLKAQREKSYSFTATAAAGLRPWQGGELYLNAELVQGVPLSNLTGLGGLSNGELQKTAGSRAKLYRSRAFLRQSWGLGDEREALESDFNQLAGNQAARRVVLTAGNLAVSDIFDENRYAHDARTNFLNWAFLTHGHYDFAADSRGYSNGAALEWIDTGWALRGGRFAVPRESNGLVLDGRLGSRYGDQIELERQHSLGGREGKLRLLLFRNVAEMARLDDALAQGVATGSVPRLDGVRRLQSKRGWGLALEQDISSGLGGFVRAGRNDGKTEVYSFASIDNAASAGLVWKGATWGRVGDEFGLALASQGLSPSHRRFLAASGSDFFIGDGALRYGRETIIEAVYTAAVAPRMWMAVDLQQIRNPAYNRDRGPVQLWALRLHAEL
jgi:hypothetical protein